MELFDFATEEAVRRRRRRRIDRIGYGLVQSLTLLQERGDQEIPPILTAKGLLVLPPCHNQPPIGRSATRLRGVEIQERRVLLTAMHVGLSENVLEKDVLGK